MKPAILLFCVSLLFGQSSSPAPESKAQPPAGSAAEAIQQAAQAAAARREQAMQATAVNRQSGSFDILSDTQGVDFGPYLKEALADIRENWYHLIRERDAKKKGKLAIEFAITKEGKVAAMKIVATSGDPTLDRPAEGSITASSPFKPLPEKFTGPYLALRVRFYYNPDKSDLDGSAKEILPEPAHTNEGTPISSTPSIPSKSGVAVNISSSGDSTVPTGESRVMIATVTGAKKKTVKWSISGLGCINSSCGEMVGNLYLAPSAPPNPSEVTLTAVSKADPTAKASVIVHIVEPTSKTASKP